MMDAIARFVRRVVNLLRVDRRERDMEEEMRFHIHMEARDLVAHGLPSEIAERTARLRFGVASRTREFGVRLALGANARSLLGLVLGQGLRLAGMGVVLGTLGAVAATRLMRSMLFDVTPGDPVTIGVVGAGICVVAVVAGVLPAKRAMSVDPVTSLREE
ncbi:MAG: FtsX-like permease family protein [bacterium]